MAILIAASSVSETLVHELTCALQRAVYHDNAASCFIPPGIGGKANLPTDPVRGLGDLKIRWRTIVSAALDGGVCPLQPHSRRVCA